jgi:hypothetical protein
VDHSRDFAGDRLPLPGRPFVTVGCCNDALHGLLTSFGPTGGQAWRRWTMRSAHERVLFRRG